MKMSYIYGSVAFLVAIYLIFLFVKISRLSSAENKRYLLSMIFFAEAALVSCTVFLFSGKYICALVFCEIYHICAVWMTFSFFKLFALNTNFIPVRKKIEWIYFAALAADSLLMLANTFTKQSLDLLPSMSVYGARFWWMDFKTLFYFHLAFCYLMAASVVVVLVLNSAKAPKFYKKKYLIFLIAYFAVLICNFQCYSMKLSVDYSVLLYGIFVAFITIYSTQAFPSYLVTNVMEKVSESISDAIIHFDYAGNVIYQNEAAKKLFDSESGFFKMSVEDFKRKYLEGKKDEMSIKWENEAVIFTIDLNLKNEENPENRGGAKHFRVGFQELKIQNSVIGSYIKITDKTEEKIRYQKEKYAATHDELTGLFNRAGFFEEVERQIKLKTFKNPLMICSNIKDFKIVNDVFGEPAGDEILLRHASVLREKAKENDINGRLGDDKFAIFMEKSHFKAEDFEKEFKELGKIKQSNSYQMFISAGIYEVHDLTENVQLMYDKAKVALDTVKADYLKTLAFYDSALMDKLLAEKNIINNFEKAIGLDEFEVYFQPIFDLQGNVRSAEALARWNNPELGMVYPADFIEVLEHTGLVYKLDKIICEKAVAQFAEWKKKNYGIRTIACNASSRDEYYFDTISFLKEAAKKYGISPDSLIIEVKEDALINDYENGSHFFERMKEAGFKVSIDDFGSGYSSLNMLKDFNVDAVKISADFFSGNEFSSRSEIILRSMLEMVKDLNIEAAALGIENETQKKLLSDLGCSVFQGFLFSKPLPADEFEEKFLK